MKAISPVIATVIIVAVTIAVAIAVALWMTGLVGSFTGTENLQIINSYALYNASSNGWFVFVQIKNAGTTTATIDQVFINGIPYTGITIGASTITLYTSTTVSTASLPIPLTPGQNTTIILFIPQGTGPALSFSSGQQVEVKIHTASGKTYPTQVTLP
ncbi:archaellin/type IV pilin N-terminal domain-containing protein [Thermogladius sp. 4427co]|uniref:archaellin/type IV pilin N-terminal domain-containing protein n=1 Tax=Thermogladius sp. 4427co TaxID=3450718 RepID=UPI003F78ED1D